MDLEKAWSVEAVDQEDLESQLISQASSALVERENELDRKRLAQTAAALTKLYSRLRSLQRKLADPRTLVSQRERLRTELAQAEAGERAQLLRDEREIQERIDARLAEQRDARAENRHAAPGAAQRLPDESEHEFLVRTGKITPFADGAGELDAEPGDEASTDHRVLAKPAQAAQAEAAELRAEQAKEEEVDEIEIVDVESLSTKRDDGIRSDYLARRRRWDRLQTAPPGEDVVLDKAAGFKVPHAIWRQLFGYQRTGVRWLWELYSQKVGGIVGDEMGLGKTVQVAAFIAALHHSGLLTKPVLIVCPATVLDQWVDELHQWWPPLRVAIMHSIGTAMGGSGSRGAAKAGDSDAESDAESESDEENSDAESRALSRSQTAAKRLLADIFETGHVVVTTYAGVKIYERFLVQREWGYACLDEGHKIRNPDSEISLACKQIRTPYRLILSGTPIQNNLTELWSLFDFIFPGRLGTLPVFQTQFSVPITIGGYANATNIQVQTAFKCAVVLRDMIAPYMIRRMKSDVAADLPKKTEKVLFCKLTKPQKAKYVDFLKSEELGSIMKGKRQVLYGVDILRKICNHPDLVLLPHQQKKRREAGSFGDPTRSGKMQVVQALLELWHTQGHRALLFSQTKQMLDILEAMIRDMGLRHLRMDGATPIHQRQLLVDRFNKSKENQVFLLTTKVGGLGVNLTGANRVIIFDPDWNPSTDIQARERAWRLGQKSEVMIYRLMIAGSIEEKIYQRQIFKQFLTNKILKDPRQKRFFKTTDLHDLFTLGSGTESADMFADRGVPEPKRRRHEGSEREPSQAGAAAAGAAASEGSEPEVKQEAPDDLEALGGVQRASDFRTAEDAQPQGTAADRQESSLLEGLFAKAGVQSSLEHDAVLDASRPDTVIMEREAQRVAAQASAAIRDSYKEARRSKIGTPTWTGRSGLAGKLKSRKAKTEKDGSPAASSSSSILAGLRAKRDLESKAGSEHLSAPVREQMQQMQRVRAFLESRESHDASSAEIVDALKIKLDGPEDVTQLRQLLRQVADWRDKRWWLRK